MGRKDGQMHTLPVDRYRRQIGTQYRKRTTSDSKAEKRKTELKSNAPKFYEDVKVVLSGFAGVVMLAYLLLYVWLSKKVE